ncbi:MAG TPA: OmpA family protein [Flavisolibacter sp.]|jgi:outer membrane protein OmpA-like peptidoglycan-associated protein|nr:OmpA family protein [Flavisolibacter sp.]
MTCIYKLIFLILFTNLIVLNSNAQGKDTLINAYFSTNSYKIDSRENNKLDTLFNRVSYVKEIIGYTDSTGGDKYNLVLSKNRVQEVGHLLNKLSIPLQNGADFKGKEHEQDPLLWKNRRVEIFAVLKDEQMVHVESCPTVITSINLDNIYFIPDMARITEESLPNIDELARTLKFNYRNNKFEIIGHVNYKSHKDSFELRDLYMLSERRAKTVYELLLERGVPAERMKYKGVGNSQPVIDDPQNDEQKKKNMRVQVLVIKNNP